MLQTWRRYEHFITGLEFALSFSANNNNLFVNLVHHYKANETILTIKIPEGKAPDISKYVKNMGGEVISNRQMDKAILPEIKDQSDEVRHEAYFGENIKKVLSALSK